MREDNEIAEMGDMAGANENKSKGSNEGEQKVVVVIENSENIYMHVFL